MARTPRGGDLGFLDKNLYGIGLELAPDEKKRLLELDPAKLSPIEDAWSRLCRDIIARAVMIVQDGPPSSVDYDNSQQYEKRKQYETAQRWIRMPRSFGAVTFAECCVACGMDDGVAYNKIINHLGEKAWQTSDPSTRPSQKAG